MQKQWITLKFHDGTPGLCPLGNSRSTAGNGLGLAIAAAVGELNGSRVVLCHNDPGLGVTLEREQKPSS
jgi:hypothetical protein